MEEKIADGIYITKKVSKSSNIKDLPEKPKKIDDNFVFTNTGELIALLETQLEEYFKETKDLYESNEIMLDYNSKDYDILEAREENLVIINKNLIKMKQIQDELRKYCPTNPLVNMNLWDFLGDDGKVKNKKIDKLDSKIELTTDNIISSKIKDNITTELEL